MSSNEWIDLHDQKACQDLANTKKNDFLDCLDEASFQCFREAYVIAKVSAWDPVLIMGPNGTGKTGYAKLIWNENECTDVPEEKRETLTLNCAAFPENLIETELFGHDKGAFTDAKSESLGKIRTAYLNKQCLFLDEVGDLPLSAQAMLLRFFDNGEVQPVGAPEPIRLKDFKASDIKDKKLKEKYTGTGAGNGNGKLKVVCATNKNLKEEIRKGNFREDLFNRMNKYCVEVPPLCIRPRDCEQNFDNFFNIRFKEKNKGALWLDRLKIDREGFGEANEKSGYQWPGNFRELQNRLQQAIVRKLLNGGGTIGFDDLFPEGIAEAKARATNGEMGANTVLSDFGFPDPDGALPQFDLPQKLSELENAYIRKALAQVKTQADAAKLLGYKSYQTMGRRQKT